MQLVIMQWLNCINHQFKVTIYIICEVSDAIELYADFKFNQVTVFLQAFLTTQLETVTVFLFEKA